MMIKDLLVELKANRYKITEPRKAIFQVLVENQNQLISVENLLKQSRKIYYKINISTVYRNLEILEHLDLIYKDITGEGITLYKLQNSHENHYHIICKTCGKTEIIEYCPLSSLEKISKDKEFQLTGHKIELYGYCKHCRQS